ncbi:glycosyl transferase family 2 [Chryseobacterium sp. BLS98]|uniref:glycosyltransferase family 2 protein n=1 Tax=Chryseobacterium sp. BLS98 TaxID=885586 RepID=UPI00065B026B|nr:glycosyltransferase [Chryseobacterium sp. BLS98]KMQ62822.1 glycosyl transferase family 2 [Chryseobacterium sp. BLS98]
MKTFSVLIAHYNNGKYFKDCYASLISQTSGDWEAIIVDDASTDDSVEIIKKLIDGDDRFRLYQNPENKGCGFTKRKCVDYATTDFCAFLDPDDALFPDAIACSLKKMNSDEGIVATYSQVLFCDRDLNPLNVFKKIKQINNNRLFFNCPIQMFHFFVFRRRIYLKTSGINPELKAAVDQDLYLKILEYGDTELIKKVLYKYRLHSGGISQNDKKEYAKSEFAKVILETIHRRGIKQINQQNIPTSYNNSEEIFQLIDYQNYPVVRLKTKIILVLKRMIQTLEKT